MQDQKELEQMTLKVTDGTPAEQAAPNGEPDAANARSQQATRTQAHKSDTAKKQLKAPAPYTPPVPWWRANLRLLVIFAFLGVSVPVSWLYGAFTGDDFLQKGHVKEAIAAFKKQLATNPQDFHVLDTLGRLSLFRKDFDQAAEYFTRALSVQPDNEDVRYMRSECYRFLNKWSSAAADLSKLNSPHLVDQLRCESALGHTKAADALLHSILRARNYQHESDNRYKLLMIAQHWNEAIALCTQQIQENTGKIRQLQWLLSRGDAYRQSGQLQQALADYDEFARRNVPGEDGSVVPLTNDSLTVTEALMGRGQTLALLGRTDEAVDAYKKVIAALQPAQRQSYAQPNLQYRLNRAYAALREIFSKRGNAAELNRLAAAKSATDDMTMSIYPWQLNQLPWEPLDGTLGEFDLPAPDTSSNVAPAPFRPRD